MVGELFQRGIQVTFTTDDGRIEQIVGVRAINNEVDVVRFRGRLRNRTGVVLNVLRVDGRGSILLDRRAVAGRGFA